MGRKDHGQRLYGPQPFPTDRAWATDGNESRKATLSRVLVGPQWWRHGESSIAEYAPYFTSSRRHCVAEVQVNVLRARASHLMGTVCGVKPLRRTLSKGGPDPWA